MTAPTSDVSNTLLTTYGALFIAMIAGAFSLLGLIISKEEKVSEFRQTWIDALRKDVANLIAYANIIYAALLKFAKEEHRDAAVFLSHNSENYIKANSALSRIKLRLNGKESESQNLLKHIEGLEQLLEKAPELLDDPQFEIEPINKEIHTSAAKVLKSEWTRVKRGEWQYRAAKYLAVLLFMGALVLVFLALRSSVRIGLFN
jgi:septal ring factor EnvC (AmiA/AmiB activator)